MTPPPGDSIFNNEEGLNAGNDDQAVQPPQPPPGLSRASSSLFKMPPGTTPGEKGESYSTQAQPPEPRRGAGYANFLAANAGTGPEPAGWADPLTAEDRIAGWANTAGGSTGWADQAMAASLPVTPSSPREHPLAATARAYNSRVPLGVQQTVRSQNGISARDVNRQHGGQQ